MTRIASLLPFVVIAALSLGASACSDNPVGRVCFIGADAGTGQQNIIASPALECQSRTCLHMAGRSPDMCTAECSSDSDCDKVPESPCDKGFACIVPVTVGPFCCKKECVCRDYLVVPDGGIQDPAACDSANAANECCNLQGRRDNPMYPGCSSK
jgi:hypothetical protein